MAEAQADFQRGEVTGPMAHSESVTDGTQTRVSHRAQWCSVQDGDVLPSVFTEAEGGSRQDQCSLRSPHRANGPRGSPAGQLLGVGWQWTVGLQGKQGTVALAERKMV